MLDESAAILPKFRWAGGDIGLRHRLGGVPEFIQHAEWPDCPACRARMTFYAQLDSINDDLALRPMLAGADFLETGSS
jgi:hypothetical protein